MLKWTKTEHALALFAGVLAVAFVFSITNPSVMGIDTASAKSEDQQSEDKQSEDDKSEDEEDDKSEDVKSEEDDTSEDAKSEEDDQSEEYETSEDDEMSEQSVYYQQSVTTRTTTTQAAAPAVPVTTTAAVTTQATTQTQEQERSMEMEQSGVEVVESAGMEMSETTPEMEVVAESESGVKIVEQEERLFFLIPVSVETEVETDANGTVVSTRQSFANWLLDFFSF